jgi:LemA protein
VNPLLRLFHPLIFVAVGVILVLVWVISTMNRFARLRHLIFESWANIDVALKRRYDLIPNLVETVKGYTAHERDTLERIVQARTRAMAARGDEKIEQEREFVRSLNILFAHVEDYPELRSSGHFLQLQNELVNTEDRIAAARRFYNANVREYNTLLESFPASLLAGGQAPRMYFEVDDLAVRQAPVVALEG